MAAPLHPRDEIARFAELIAEELDRLEVFGEDVEGETVEDLLSRLVAEAGDVFQAYVEDEGRGPVTGTERACARVAGRALIVARAARSEAGR